MTQRTRAREVTLQLLYESDRNPTVPPELIERFVEERLRRAELRQFALDLFHGVLLKRAELDAILTRVAEHWSVSRMSPVDRNILRLGAFEILFCGDTPPKAALDEAVELAKRYGTADSSRFVNGLLDRVLAEREPPPSKRESGLAGVARP